MRVRVCARACVCVHDSSASPGEGGAVYLVCERCHVSVGEACNRVGVGAACVLCHGIQGVCERVG